MAKNRQEFISEGLSPEEVSAFEEYSQGGGPAPVETAPVAAEPVQPEQAGNAPEAATGEQTAPPAQQDQRMVDVRAVQEARAAQRAAEQRLAQMEEQARENQARLDERLKIINDALAGKGQEEPKIPTKEDDVLGFYDHQFESVNGKFQTLEQKLAAMEKSEQDRIAAENAFRQKQQTFNQVNAVYEQARAKYPEIDEALSFAGQKLRDDIAARLLNAGYTGDQFIATGQQMYNEAVDRLISQCPRDPEGAAEHIRRNARYWGWMPSQPQQVAPQAPAQMQPQPAPQIQQPTPQQRAEQQQRHMSLSGTQGGQPPMQLDAKTLASMSDDQFFALKRSVEGRQRIESIKAGN